LASGGAFLAAGAGAAIAGIETTADNEIKNSVLKRIAFMSFSFAL
jgi:hypothetical protein